MQKNNDTVTHNGRGAKFSDTKYVSVLFILLFYSCVCPFYLLFLFILFSRNTAKHDTLRKGSAYPLKDVTLTPCKKQLKHS